MTNIKYTTNTICDCYYTYSINCLLLLIDTSINVVLLFFQLSHFHFLQLDFVTINYNKQVNILKPILPAGAALNPICIPLRNYLNTEWELSFFLGPLVLMVVLRAWFDFCVKLVCHMTPPFSSQGGKFWL